MELRSVAIGSCLFMSVLWACRDESSPARETDAGTDAGTVAGENHQHASDSGGDDNTGSQQAEDKRSIGGEVSGLNGSGLILELNNKDQLDVDERGPFTFATKLAKNADYRVSVGTQPSHPVQACEVSQGSGKVAESNVDSVRIACSDVKRTISGSVTGLDGGEIKLKYNGSDDLTVKADGDFSFMTTFATNANDDLTIAAAPVGRTCSLTRTHGTTNGGDVTGVKVACYAGLKLQARAGVSSVELSWNDNGATSYTVYRSTDKSCDFDAAEGCAGSGKSENVRSPYQWIEGLDNGTVYYFHVRGDHPDNFTTKSDKPAPSARPNVAEFDKQVRAISTGDNHTVYVGGDFSAVGPYTGPVAPIERTTGCTSRIPSFPIIPGLSNAVRVVAADGSGGYFVGGSFNLLIDGVTRRNLIHIRADGTVDTTWNPDPNGPVKDLSLVGDRLYLAGDFLQFGSIERWGLALVSATGTGALDTQWDPSPTPYQFVQKIVANSTGVYIAGPFTEINGITRTFLVKLNKTNGDLEDFPAPDAAVMSLALSDDVLYVAGNFSNMGGVVRPRLAAISLSDGQVQATPQMGENPEEPAPSAMVVSGDLLYLGGYFSTITIGSTAEPRRGLAAINRVTGALTDWKPEANDIVRALVASGDAIYVAGDFTEINSKPSRYLAEIGTNGSLREDWAPQPGAAMYGIAVDRDSVYAFGRDVRSFGAQTREHVAAFRHGALTPWAPAVKGGNVYALAAAGSMIYVGGDFDSVGGNPHAGVAAISDTSTVRDWNAQLTKNAGDKASVRALAVGNSSVYLGGNFVRTTGDDTRKNLVALAVDNAARPETWTISGADGDVNALGVDDADLFIGGAFNLVGPSATRARLAKLNATTGAPDADWAPSANDVVQALMVIGDDLFVGGAFTEIAGAGREHLAALAKTGSGDLNSWTPALNGTVYGMASQGRALYAVGDFTNYGQGFAAIDTGKSDFPRATGVLDVSAYGPVCAVAADGDRIYIGGDSRTVAAAASGTSRCWFYCEQTKPALPP